MPNCLGIYTENNIIKYAKLNSDKAGGSFRLASYGVRFSDNTSAAIEKIIQETNSANDTIVTNIPSEKYDSIEVFSKLSKKDLKELVNTEFANICETKGVVPSVLEMKFRLFTNTGDGDKYKAICVSVEKSGLDNVFKNFTTHKISGLSPLGTSIVNLLPNKGIDEQIAIVNIEDETVVTVIERGEIADITSFPIGMKDVLPKLAEKYNSYSKAYEACKGVSAYIEDVYSLEEANRDIIDLLIPMLYDLRSRIENFLKPHMPLITKIYLTGTGIIINNLDIYFQEVFSDKACQILVPYFLPKDSNNLKDIVEANTAIALAFNGIGYNDKEVDFTIGQTANVVQTEMLKKKASDLWGQAVEFTNTKILNKKPTAKPQKRSVEFNDEVIEGTEGSMPVIDFGEEGGEEEEGPFLTPTEAWMARFAGATLVAFCLYSGASYYTGKVIDEKLLELNQNQSQVNAWMNSAKNDIDYINEESNKYSNRTKNLTELLNKVTTRTVSFDIPNFMSKLMFVIPENVQVTSIGVGDDGMVQISAESGQYAQLGYFVSRLKLDEVLKDVGMSVESMSGNIKIKVSGVLP